MSEPENPVVAESIGKTKRLNKAFLSVFGDPNRRSSDQELVLEHLRECSGKDNLMFGGSRNIEFNPYIAAHLDGARSQFLIIERRIANAMKEPDNKPKRSVKK